MNELTVDLSNSNDKHHECKARREGDWVIFSCDKCPGYERKINLKTHRMCLIDPGQGRYNHKGVYSPLLYNLN